jgi:hypothetical protein
VRERFSIRLGLLIRGARSLIEREQVLRTADISEPVVSIVSCRSCHLTTPNTFTAFMKGINIALTILSKFARWVSLRPSSGEEYEAHRRSEEHSLRAFVESYHGRVLTVSAEPFTEGHAGAVVSLRKFTVCSLMLALGRKCP